MVSNGGFWEGSCGFIVALWYLEAARECGLILGMSNREHLQLRNYVAWVRVLRFRVFSRFAHLLVAVNL